MGGKLTKTRLERKSIHSSTYGIQSRLYASSLTLNDLELSSPVKDSFRPEAVGILTNVPTMNYIGKRPDLNSQQKRRPRNYTLKMKRAIKSFSECDLEAVGLDDCDMSKSSDKRKSLTISERDTLAVFNNALSFDDSSDGTPHVSQTPSSINSDAPNIQTNLSSSNKENIRPHSVYNYPYLKEAKVNGANQTTGVGQFRSQISDPVNSPVDNGDDIDDLSNIKMEDFELADFQPTLPDHNKVQNIISRFESFSDASKPVKNRYSWIH